MKRLSLLLSSIALASLSIGSVAEEAKAPPVQAVEPSVDPAHLLQAKAALEQNVMAFFTTQNRADIEARRFSRVMVPPQSSSYTLAMSETAPNGVTKTPAQLPFELRHRANAQAAPTVHLAGYYDVNTKTVQVYSAAAKSYVPAAEHPFIKARMPEKKP